MMSLFPVRNCNLVCSCFFHGRMLGVGVWDKNGNGKYDLGAVHILRQPPEGGVGLSQKLTIAQCAVWAVR